MKICFRCGKKWSAVYDGPCNKCIVKMACTQVWLEKFQRRMAAKKGWETRKKRNNTKVLGIAQ